MLTDVGEPGDYEFLALPLAIEGAGWEGPVLRACCCCEADDWLLNWRTSAFR